MSEHFGQPVDLLTSGEFESMIPLLQEQPYLRNVSADHRWSLSQGWQSPPMPMLETYERVYQLGYQRWPQLPLPLEVHSNLVQQWQDADGPVPALELRRPWITVEGTGSPCDIAVGFTEAWFELKYGLLASIDHQLKFGPTLLQLTPCGSRWTTECAGLVSVEACDWLGAARAIRNSDLFFGDCSALHVLAVGLGKRVVICEPMAGRDNPIFYPLGTTGPEVRVVTGNDGNFTFDARHCADTLREELAR